MEEFMQNLDWDSIYVWATLAMIILFFVSIYISWRVQHIFDKYSKEYARSGINGKQAARMLLDGADLHAVDIGSSQGKLSDHYDPRTHVVALSAEVSNSPSLASLAVAAHECGHAIQHSKNYAFSALRMFMVPVVNFMSRTYWILLLAGIVIGLMNPAQPFGLYILIAGLVFFGSSMLFSLVTLPTEFDASNRALKLLVSTGIVSGDEVKKSKKVLTAAALTYVVAFLVALAQFVRVLAILMRNFKRR